MASLGNSTLQSRDYVQGRRRGRLQGAATPMQRQPFFAPPLLCYVHDGMPRLRDAVPS